MKQNHVFTSIVYGALSALLVSFIFWFTVTRELPSSIAGPVGNKRVFTGVSGAETQVISAVRETSPAVVSIVISKVSSGTAGTSPYNDFFNQFFGFTPQAPRSPGTPQEIGGGSGFFVNQKGLIATNKHVVEDPDALYTVYTNDGKKYKASVAARDPLLDIALIKIDASHTPFLTFADSSTVAVGETAIAIGNALAQFNNTVSVGVVSGLSRSVIAGDEFGNAEALDEVIQTDAAINPGNSGGPLLNSEGKVIGMNVAVVSGSANIGFALPGNTVLSAVLSVEKNGKIERPFLGVHYIAITSDLKSSRKLPVDYGALVTSEGDGAAVVSGSPAEKAGIVDGDILLEADGTKLTLDHTLSAAIRGKNIGDTVRLKILHKGSERTVTITLKTFPQ